MAAGLAVTAGFGARRSVPTRTSPAGFQPAAYHDLNDLKLYRARGWGLPALANPPAAWHDLNSWTLHRAGEWGAPADTRTAERRCRHLMLVK